MNLDHLSNEEAVIELLTLTCEIDEDGDKLYRNKEGEFHRIHGPAIIYKDGAEFWYKNGLTHREDGPAAIYANGREYYYIDGENLTKKQFIQWQEKNANSNKNS